LDTDRDSFINFPAKAYLDTEKQRVVAIRHLCAGRRGEEWIEKLANGAKKDSKLLRSY
jgi:hypothetical protein